MTTCKCKLQQFARLRRLADQVSAERDMTPPMESGLWHYLNDTAMALQEIAAETTKESGGRPWCTALGLNILPSADAGAHISSGSRPRGSLSSGVVSSAKHAGKSSG
jgi:hypothetical protein